MKTLTRDALLVLLGLALGCGSSASGPPTLEATSEGMSPAERVQTLQRYVTFRRPYETLDFAIDYHNNGGGLAPGPSEWDVRLVARVPESSLDEWVSGSPTERPDAVDWLDAVPTDLDTGGVDEWYDNGGVVVGLNRGARVVVYRNRAR